MAENSTFCQGGNTSSGRGIPPVKCLGRLAIFSVSAWHLPSSNQTWQWQSPIHGGLIGRSPINSVFTVAMFHYQRVPLFFLQLCWNFRVHIPSSLKMDVETSLVSCIGRAQPYPVPSIIYSYGIFTAIQIGTCKHECLDIASIWILHQLHVVEKYIVWMDTNVFFSKLTLSVFEFC